MKRLITLLLVFLCLCGCTREETPPLIVEEPAPTTEEAPTPEEAPADPPVERVTLTFAGVDPPFTYNGLDLLVDGFNRTNSRYYVQKINYSGASENPKKGAMVLNTKFMAGEFPDMLYFSYNQEHGYSYDPNTGVTLGELYLSPLPLIAKDLLLDMGPLLEQDPDISSGDIVGLRALKEYGGLYLLSSRMTMDALQVSPEVFGDQKTWTIGEFLEKKDALGPDQHLFDRMDPNAFLQMAGGRYARQTMDLDNAVCDFASPEFISILKTAAQLEHYHYGGDTEFWDAAQWGEWKAPAAQLADRDILCSVSSYFDPYWCSISRVQSHDADLTYMGWPTPDGSSGVDLRLTIPMAICADTEQAEGCWEFMKYVLQHPMVQEGDYEMPLYKPALTEYRKTYDVTQADVDLCIGLADQSEHMSFYDCDVMRIILDEAQWLLQGDDTAENVAAKIQARASLYLAEQYG